MTKIISIKQTDTVIVLHSWKTFWDSSAKLPSIMGQTAQADVWKNFDFSYGA